MVRAEVVLLKDVVLTGYEMRYLSGQGPGEVHGTNTNLIDNLTYVDVFIRGGPR